MLSSILLPRSSSSQLLLHPLCLLKLRSLSRPLVKNIGYISSRPQLFCIQSPSNAILSKRNFSQDVDDDDEDEGVDVEKLANINDCLISNPNFIKYATGMIEKYNQLEQSISSSSGEDRKRLSKDQANILPIFDAIQDLFAKKAQYEELNEMRNEEGMQEMAEEEIRQLVSEILAIEAELLENIVPPDPIDDRNVIIEIRSGAGGQEAMLFAYELFGMYQGYADTQGWKVNLMSMGVTELGGCREAVALISGRGVFSKLKYEIGVHRVQRVPETEKMGRLQTSTATVAILPEAKEVDVSIDDKDLRIDVFRASGAGGQHVNKTESAVRVTHIPTGFSVSIQEGRSQHSNKAKALQILRTRIFDVKREKEERERSLQRSQQVKNAGRSQRIRTYNFAQDRVTDHRIGMSIRGVPAMMGGMSLEDFIAPLVQEEKRQKVWEIINPREEEKVEKKKGK